MRDLIDFAYVFRLLFWHDERSFLDIVLKIAVRVPLLLDLFFGLTRIGVHLDNLDYSDDAGPLAELLSLQYVEHVVIVLAWYLDSNV